MRRNERGAVTAETAVALPLLMLVTLAMVWMLGFGVAQMRATDAAREAARALARGDSAEQAVALAHRVSPGSTVRISRHDGTVTVTVVGDVAAPVGLDELGGSARGEAVALVEDVDGAATEGVGGP